MTRFAPLMKTQIIQQGKPLREMSAPCLDGLSFIIHHFSALQIKHLSKKNTGLVNISYNTSSITILKNL
jgi:hypothetical protein